MVVASVAYTLWRALTLTVDYFDAFEYLTNAWRLIDARADYSTIRAPLLALVEAPIVALARRAGPASGALLWAPHLLAAAMSLATAAGVYWILRRRFDATLALLGLALFMSTRYFVRYGAMALSDLPATGLLVLAMGLHARAWEQRSLGAYAATGVATAAAVAMRYPAGLALPALFASEFLHAFSVATLRRMGWRIDWRRWLGLAVAFATAAGTGLAIMATTYRLVFGANARRELAALSLRRILGVAVALPGESRLDYLSFARSMLSLPLLLLIGAGMAFAIARPQRRDAPFWAWGIVMTGGIPYFMVHTEARYFLPAVPPLTYFALRAVEAVWSFTPQRWVPRFGVGALCLMSVGNGLAQARADQDPFFTAGIQRRAVQRLLSARRDQGRVFVMGGWHTLGPADPGPVPQDEFWNTFHLGPRAIGYLASTPIARWPGGNTPWSAMGLALARNARDGDAILRLDDQYIVTATFKGWGHQPMQWWSIRRIDLRHQPDSARLTSPDGSIEVRLDDATPDTLLPQQSLGTYWAFVTTRSNPELKSVGERTFTSGVPVRIGPEAGGAATLGTDLDQVVLIRVDVVPAT